jgi:hypothetical protein
MIEPVEISLPEPAPDKLPLQDIPGETESQRAVREIVRQYGKTLEILGD